MPPLSASDLRPLLAGEYGSWDSFVPKAAAVMRPPIRRVLASRRPEDEIGDVLQDCFLRLIRDDYRLLRRFDPERASLSTWLGIIASSAAIDHLRKQAPTGEPIEDHADALAAPEQPLLPNVGLPLPKDLLTPRQALILKLIYEDDRDVEEVAAILGIGAPSVRSLRHKAITRLRDFFKVPGRV
jgi:RNA polymerase sigma-70 factor (ECF subfamily)